MCAKELKFMKENVGMGGGTHWLGLMGAYGVVAGFDIPK